MWSEICIQFSGDMKFCATKAQIWSILNNSFITRRQILYIVWFFSQPVFKLSDFSRCTFTNFLPAYNFRVLFMVWFLRRWGGGGCYKILNWGIYFFPITIFLGNWKNKLHKFYTNSHSYTHKILKQNIFPIIQFGE